MRFFEYIKLMQQKCQQSKNHYYKHNFAKQHFLYIPIAKKKSRF